MRPPSAAGAPTACLAAVLAIVACRAQQVMCPGHSPFHVGEQVQSPEKGPGRVVCAAANPEVVGICVEVPHSGHDNYHIGCKQPVTRQAPSFCGPWSLWFTRCNRLRPWHPIQPIDLGSPDRRICGCSWNSQGSCVVSTQQQLLALTSEQALGRVCGTAPHADECRIRRQLIQVAGRYKKCEGILHPRECMANTECKWGAQGSGNCGIREDFLVMDLVGPENRHHPILKLINAYEHCSSLSEAWCDADPRCAWAQGYPPTCDVSFPILMEHLVMFPHLTLDVRRSYDEAMCRAKNEASLPSGMTHVCSSPCRMDNGVCVLNMDEYNQQHHQPLRKILDSACERSWQQSKLCGRGCMLFGPVCKSDPAQFSRFPRDPRYSDPRIVGGQSWAQSERIVHVMAVLMSSTMQYQLHCKSAHAHWACQTARPTCGDQHLVFPNATPQNPFGGSGEGGASHPAEHGSAGMGYKGIFKEAAEAIASGRAGEYVEDYFENHPDAVKNLSQKALASLSTYFNKQKEGEAPPAATTPPAPSVESTTALASEPYTVEVDDGESEDETLVFLSNPWLVATSATLVAAACGGLAMGALCHARLLRTPAREPLLASGGNRPMLREPDMEIPRELEAMGVTPVTHVEAGTGAGLAAS